VQVDFRQFRLQAKIDIKNSNRCFLRVILISSALNFLHKTISAHNSFEMDLDALTVLIKGN